MRAEPDSSAANAAPSSPATWLERWQRVPLYARILGAMLLGIAAGLLVGRAASSDQALTLARYCLDIGKLILRLLSMVALPLIFVAIIHSLVGARVDARTGRRLVGLLLTNTLVAIVIGLIVADVLQPGRFASLGAVTSAAFPALDLWDELKKKVPESFIGSLVPNWESGRQDVIPAILIALGVGLALRKVRQREQRSGGNGAQSVVDFFETFYGIFMVALTWIVGLIPIAVFAIVASVVMTRGIGPFVSLIGFVGAVLIALALQAGYYLLRVRLQSWVRPMQLLRGGAEALLTAFSTASSTATAPLNYQCLREKIGLREESATMGALVGSNFNNDGTALYEAMGPMYVAQALGQPIPLLRQPVVAFMAVIASNGAPGIPEAGLVTMLLVFQAVGMPTEYVALLLPVDWFLDRCRTMINLMGDMSVACVLDGKLPEARTGPSDERAER